MQRRLLCHTGDPETANGVKAMTPFALPQGGAALPLTFTPRHLRVLVIGSNRLAATRVLAFLEADADVTVACPFPLSETHKELQHRVKRSDIRYSQLRFDDLLAWATYFSENDIALVCVTDTMIGAPEKKIDQFRRDNREGL